MLILQRAIDYVISLCTMVKENVDLCAYLYIYIKFFRRFCMSLLTCPNIFLGGV